MGRERPAYPRVDWSRPLAQGLVAAYPFFTGSGDVTREVASNRTGALQDDPVWTTEGIDLDGASDAVDIGQQGKPTTGEITVAAWVTADILDDFERIVDSSAQRLDISQGYRLLYGGTTKDCWRFAVGDGSSNAKANSDIVPATGQRYCLIGTWDGTTVRLYVDGEQDGTTPTISSISYPTDANVIGATANTNTADGQWWDGLIEQVLIYDRALNDSEVRRLNNNEWALYQNEGRIIVPFLSSTATSETITLGHIGSSAQLHAPTLTQTSNDLTLGHIGSSAQLHAPTLSEASQTVTLGHIGSSAQLHAPSITEGTSGVDISLGHIGSSAQLHAPTLTQTSNDLTLGHIGSSAQLHAPSINETPNDLTLGHIGSSAQLHPPTLTEASQTVTLGHIGSSAQLHSFSIAEGTDGDTLTLGHIGSSAQLHAPTIVSSEDIQLGHIASSAQMHAPTINVSTNDLSLGHITSSAQLHAPSLSLTSQTITLGRIESAAQMHAPSINVTPVNVTLGHITSSAHLHAMTFDVPTSITLGHIASSAELHTFRLPLVFGSVDVVIEVVTSASVEISTPTSVEVEIQ